ncbi:hypothetical protein T07_5256 [Trichinella nelsoni]|uniref:Uncharacterized protein n=1 Tax=Trichinella nelsoni TaxID=6336 RepID=A0A0V0RHI0_9BILA|nr:hypothetical protein T07_5256 [Trichinella nelsoni]
MPIRIALYKICMLMNRELKSSVHYVLTAQKSSPLSLQGCVRVKNTLRASILSSINLFGALL